MKKVCILDIDGTLINSIGIEPIFYSVTNKFYLPDSIFLASCFKYSILSFLSKCRNTKEYGNIDNLSKHLMEKLVSFYGNDINLYKDFMKEFLTIEKQIIENNVICFDGANNLLDFLTSEGYILYAYSNWFLENQKTKLETAGIYKYFSNLYTIDNFYAKPSLKGFSTLLNENDINSYSDKVFMIGDSTSDITPKSLKIPSIIVKNGKDSVADTILKKADFIVDNLNSVKTLVKNK